jgi:hypothetical protein
MLMSMWQNRKSYTMLIGMQVSTTTKESSMEILQKTEYRSAIWPTYTTDGHLPKGM